jgi:geranylgeranyl pyrophosphate synthase
VDISWVIRLFEKYKAVAAARTEAESLVAQGKKEVSTVPVKLRKVLYEFADFAVGRSR